MGIEYMCALCGKTFPRYNSLNRFCPRCQRIKYLKPSKRLNKIGPVTKKLIEQRKQWIIDSPPDDNGNWVCYLQISPQCLKLVTADTLNLEHVESRARRPDLRFDKTNLKPSCQICNSKKGSKSASEVLDSY